ncbi:MAG: hypothetical protein QM488_01975 [Rhizobiaceae bacterium]
MSKFLKWVGIPLISIVAIAWLYLQFAYPTYAVRYQLSVEVETPTGTKTGIGVLESIIEYQVQFLPNVPSSLTRIRGEAIPIDIGNGRYLFITLRQDSKRKGSRSAIGLALANLSPSKVKYPESRMKDYWIRANNSPLRHLVPNQLPLLVTFTDINDPASLQRVEPDELEKYFGAGVRFGEVTLEIVNESVSSGRIEKTLAWWKNLSTPIGGDTKRNYGDPLYGLGKSYFRKS